METNFGIYEVIASSKNCKLTTDDNINWNDFIEEISSLISRSCGFIAPSIRGDALSMYKSSFIKFYSKKDDPFDKSYDNLMHIYVVRDTHENSYGALIFV